MKFLLMLSQAHSVLPEVTSYEIGELTFTIQLNKENLVFYDLIQSDPTCGQVKLLEDETFDLCAERLYNITIDYVKS